MRSISLDDWLSPERDFYIMDFVNFTTASRQCIGAINKLVDGQLVDYTYDVEHVVDERTHLL